MIDQGKIPDPSHQSTSEIRKARLLTCHQLKAIYGNKQTCFTQKNKVQFRLRICLEYDLFSRIAACLREAGNLDSSARYDLAKKLRPPSKRKGIVRYEWIRGSGRPRRDRGDPLETAMNNGDLAVIADHLRNSECVDPRVITWLADQFDPPLPSSSRFVIKKRRKPREGESPDELFAKYMRIGEIVARYHREYGKLEAALTKAKELEKVSTSAAFRAHEIYKNPMKFCTDRSPALQLHYVLMGMVYKNPERFR
jgi:hypothetical protein